MWGRLQYGIKWQMGYTNDKRIISPQSKLQRKGLENIGLLDVWREFQTFYSAPHAVYSRIDYFFMFQNDRHRILDCDIGTRNISDYANLFDITLETQYKFTEQ